MENCGICGTDIHMWKQNCLGDYVFAEPVVLGHEASGTICAVGEGVTHLKVGKQYNFKIVPFIPFYCNLEVYHPIRAQENAGISWIYK